MSAPPEPPADGPRPTRRAVLVGLGGALAVAGAVRPAAALDALAGAPAPAPPPPDDLRLAPRPAWAGDGAPPPPMPVEAPGDVRTLVVHHTAGGNGYAAADVPGLLRGTHRAHTARGWPDVAYNFFVDRHGGVWEGRSGSAVAPVRGDATGGSQGFALLCCFVGDHRVEPPSPAATRAMAALLAWLADAYGVDTTPGATTTFPSRGSNRWPAGSAVTVATIAAHRDVSRTECPGDAGARLVAEDLPALVTARRRAVAATTTTTTPSPAPAAADPGGHGPPGWAAPAGGLGAAGLLAAGARAAARRRRDVSGGR